MGNIGKYFDIAEFACKCGQCEGIPGDLQPEIEKYQTVGIGLESSIGDLFAVLDRARQMAGNPYMIHCGYRCHAHNADVGSKPTSKHIWSRYGCAADGRILGYTPSTAALIVMAAANYLEIGISIGIYQWGIHIDTRIDEKTRNYICAKWAYLPDGTKVSIPNYLKKISAANFRESAAIRIIS